MRARRVRAPAAARFLRVALLGAALGACVGDAPAAPGGARSLVLGVRFHGQPEDAAAALELADRIAVRVSTDGAVVLDTLVAFTRAADEGVPVRLAVPEGARAYDVEVELRQAATALFRGSAAVTLAPGVASRADVVLAAVRPFARVTTGDTIGIRDVTPFTFIASGRNPAWQGYEWDFGDGATATGDTVTHVYSRAGVFRVTARGREGAGGSSMPIDVTVGSLTGTWEEPTQGAGVKHRLVIVQEGTALSGQWFVTFAPGSPYGTPADTSISPLSGTIGVGGHRQIALAQNGECGRTMTNGTVSRDLQAFEGLWTYVKPECLPAGVAFNLSFRRR